MRCIDLIDMVLQFSGPIKNGEPEASDNSTQPLGNTVKWCSIQGIRTRSAKWSNNLFTCSGSFTTSASNGS